jgi:NAD(P)-dependent dehydrogenase (short-subunit alcohol dehydrogenase family)
MFTPKPLHQQVVVITGASSGIGLATARLLSAMGANLVIAARNGEALDAIADELDRPEAGCIVVAIDVADEGAAEAIAAHAVERFGRIDTWVNNAAVASFAELTDVSIEDHRRAFDVNYFGLVQGSQAAARRMRGRGGTIINVGSVLSDRALILQGVYSASKAAVKAYTDALRMELAADGLPINVTLIKPSAIDTPYIEHARNQLGSAGTVTPPPHYTPDTVAEAIAFACENRRRTLTVGFGGYIIGAIGIVAPGLTDFVMRTFLVNGQKSRERGVAARRDNLYEPREDGAERSSLGLPARNSSLFLKAQMYPLATAALLAGGALALALAARPATAMDRLPPRRRSLVRNVVTRLPHALLLPRLLNALR